MPFANTFYLPLQISGHLSHKVYSRSKKSAKHLNIWIVQSWSMIDVLKLKQNFSQSEKTNEILLITDKTNTLYVLYSSYQIFILAFLRYSHNLSLFTPFTLWNAALRSTNNRCIRPVFWPYYFAVRCIIKSACPSVNIFRSSISYFFFLLSTIVYILYAM